MGMFLFIQCDSIVDSVGPDVIQLIAQEANPDVICSKLRAC